jgi:hypothetical protein
MIINTGCNHKSIKNLSNENSLIFIGRRLCMIKIFLSKINPGIFGDQWQPMMIWLDLKIGIGYRCHRVADANFAVSKQKIIGYPTNANDGTRKTVDGTNAYQFNKFH